MPLQHLPAGLEALGWSSFFDEPFRPFRERGFVAARVAVGHRSSYRLYTEFGEVEADLAGTFHHTALDGQAFPAVGDWVAIKLRAAERKATIHAILPRRTRFSRQAAGQAAEEQVVAANVDTVLLVSGLDQDFNPRRLERYLVVAWQSGAEPVVVLSKADLCADVAAKVRQVRALAPGVPVHAISAPRDDGLADLRGYLQPGRTVALVGSSGVGKSTLINRLAGRELARTGEVRASDGRGRHTTTHRELIVLPSGGLIVDTPGLRELQLWAAEAGHRAAFDDLAVLAERCRFRDCTHRAEPGCALRQAREEGSISAARVESFAKLRRELDHLETRLDMQAQLAQKRQHRAIHRQMRNYRPRG